jgi:hypothetical protein
MMVPVRSGLFDLDADGEIRLIGGRCPACAHLHFPAGDDCPYCSHQGCERTHLSGEGEVWEATMVHSAPPGYAGAVPYGFGVVELPEGLRIVARLLPGGELLAPGTAVRAVADVVGRDEAGSDLVTYAFARRDP